MQREKDYLKKKIDKLAIMLAELLSKVTKTDVAFTKEEFTTELDRIILGEKNCTISILLELEEKEFLQNMTEKYEFNAHQLSVLADLLYEYTKSFEGYKSNLNPKIIILYENCITEGIALSLDKYKLIERLK